MASKEIEALAAMLKTKNYIIAFTGAGISTESGIPDFRSQKTGLWEKINPELLSVRTLKSNPESFYRYFRVLQEAAAGKVPNDGHNALAELSRLGIIRSVVTQNIDGLHQKAGSKRVFEVHGNLEKCRCIGCKAEYPYEVLDKEIRQGNYWPKSPCCGKMLRPSVVLFGDMMADDFSKAQQEAFRSDFCLVIGTSLTVYPAAQIPQEVGQYAIINRDNTQLDDGAAVRISQPIGKALSALCECLKAG